MSFWPSKSYNYLSTPKTTQTLSFSQMPNYHPSSSSPTLFLKLTEEKLGFQDPILQSVYIVGLWLSRYVGIHQWISFINWVPKESQSPKSISPNLIRVSGHLHVSYLIMIQLFNFNLIRHDLIKLHDFQLISHIPMLLTWLWWWIYEESLWTYELWFRKAMHVLWKWYLWTKDTFEMSINETVKGFLTYYEIIVVKDFLTYVRIMIIRSYSMMTNDWIGSLIVYFQVW